MKEVEFTVDSEDVARGRLDKVVLAHAPGSTRALVAECFSRHGVTADGRPAAKSDRPAAGMRIVVSGLAEASDRTVRPEDGPLAVVWEGAGLVAADKPAGQPCHPVSIGETGTLAAALLGRYPDMAGIGDDPLMPGLLHRIDAGTSGLVLAARSRQAFDAVRAQFTAHAARKVYLAEVVGRVDRPGGVSGLLAHSTSFRGRMRCVSGSALPGKERAMFAETFYRPLEVRRDTTLLEVTILTGVTHQIRCQLASLGHPIVGDTTYGAPAPLAGSFGPFHRLHALSVAFTPPGADAPITVRTPCPDWGSVSP